MLYVILMRRYFSPLNYSGNGSNTNHRFCYMFISLPLRYLVTITRYFLSFEKISEIHIFRRYTFLSESLFFSKTVPNLYFEVVKWIHYLGDQEP